MFEKPSMEIPAAVRQMAEQNIEQTRQAYSQFMMLAQQAQMMMVQGQGQGDGVKTVVDAQAKAMRMAQENIEANFRFATELARARDISEYAAIQQRYAEGQIKAFQQQTEELGRIMTDLAKKVTPG